MSFSIKAHLTLNNVSHNALPLKLPKRICGDQSQCPSFEAAKAYMYAQQASKAAKCCCVQVAGFNMEQVNKWQWRPDYEGVDLNHCRSDFDHIAALSHAPHLSLLL